MEDKYLAINAGSSSLKFMLSFMPSGNEIVSGSIEKIGENDSSYTLKFDNQKLMQECCVYNHTDAVELMLEKLFYFGFIKSGSEIKGVGHRIAHGAEAFAESTVITNEVLQTITSLTKFAPIHMPGEIEGIKSMQKVLPDVPNIAVFDTAFHQTIPKENYIYAIPYEFYEKHGIRKYGFHGTSHKYITECLKQKYGKKDVNIISCHIGNGSSIDCIKNGKSINTTMGMTPLDGVIMGTRSGSIDPAIIEYICKEKNISVEDATAILNFESGLLGIAGKNDFRDIETLMHAGNPQAKLALTMLEKSIIKYIAEYYIELEGKVDALVFTAGMGENAILLREEIVNKLSSALGIKLNKEANDNIARFKKNQSGIISTEDSKFDVIVLPTNEEHMILKDTYDLSIMLREKGQSRALKL